MLQKLVILCFLRWNIKKPKEVNTQLPNIPLKSQPGVEHKINNLEAENTTTTAKKSLERRNKLELYNSPILG